MSSHPWILCAELICLRKFVTFQKTGTYQFKQHLKHIMVFFAMSAGASIYLNLDVVMLRFLQSMKR